MVRNILFLAVVLSANAFAHLNHVQFAAVDDVDGKLRVRYRMSADMFMSNLDADIKNKRLDESIKQRPIDEIIRSYFKTHLVLDIDGTRYEAESASFEFDSKTSDWVADFGFQAPSGNVRTTLICDAFLENNPRTQTLARINWRGENTMFHFRLGSVRYVLGSSLVPASSIQAAPQSELQTFLDGLAQALKAYDFLAAGSLMLVVLGQIFAKLPRVVIPVLAVAASAALSADQCGRAGFYCEAGYAFGWLAIVLTVFRVFTAPALNSRADFQSA